MIDEKLIITPYKKCLHWLTSGTITDTISLQKLEYDYDPLGNLDWIKDYKAGINPATPQTQIFGYDSLNRLTSASATGGLNDNGNYSESYSYDANTGNLASKSGLGNYTYNAQVTCAAGTRTIPHAVSSAGGNSYTYDCNGNQIQRNVGGTQNLSYNAENKLVSVSGTVTANFVYDGDGKRVKSTLNGSSVVYIGNDYEWTSSGVTQYYTTGSQRVGMRRSGYASNNGLFWMLGDHLSSTSITASANGSFFSEQRYTAWGSNRYTSGSLLSQRQYTGQINDGFGLYFYNARFYDPLLARFSQADTIVPGENENYTPLTVDYSENKFLQQLNQENRERLENNLDARSPFVSTNALAFDRYAYSYNNPIIYSDPDGHCAFLVPIFAGALIGGAISTLTYVTITKLNGETPTWAGGLGAFAGGAVAGAVSVIATPVAGTLIKAVHMTASGTALVAGTAAVNAAGGAVSYCAAGYTTNAVDAVMGNTPQFKPTIEGAIVNAAVAGVLSPAAGKLLPVANKTMSTLKQANKFMPGRTIRTLFATKNAQNNYGQAVVTVGIGALVGYQYELVQAK